MAEIKRKQIISGIITRIGPLNGASQVDIQFMIEGYDNIFVVFAGWRTGLAKIGDHVNFVYKKEFIGHVNVEHNSFVIEGLFGDATRMAIEDAKNGNTTDTTLEML